MPPPGFSGYSHHGCQRWLPFSDGGSRWRVTESTARRSANAGSPIDRALLAVRTDLLGLGGWKAPGPGRNRTLTRLATAVTSVLHWFRFGVDRWLLIPVARQLPQGIAFACADIAAGIDLLLPTSTSRVARAEVQAATRRTGRAGLGLSWTRLAASRRDLVSLTRMAHGRDPLRDWRVIEKDRDRVRPLFDSGESLVLVTGHFSTAAFHVMQKSLPRAGAFVRGDVAREAKSVGERQRQLGDRSRDEGRQGLLGPIYPGEKLTITVPDVWGPDADWSQAASRTATVKQMLSVLRHPDGIVVVRIDADWAAPGGYSRPFAGRSQRSFAMGSARVARLSQSYVVPFVAVMGKGQRTVILEWGEPIPPPGRDEESADVRVMDEALAFIESGIARHPAQYQPPIGIERRWQEDVQRWI